MSERLISLLEKGLSVGSASTVQLSTGGWVTAWMTLDDYSNGTVNAQIFAADGSIVGDRIVIEQHTEQGSYALDVHAQSDGGWSIRWSENAYGGFDNIETHFRLFDGTGEQVRAWKYEGAERGWSGKEFSDGTFLIGNPTLGDGFVKTDFRGSILGTYEFGDLGWDPHSGRYDVLADGGWVMTWNDGSLQTLKMQRYGADGELVGSVEVLDSGADYGYRDSVTALSDGGWIVYWEDTNDGRRYVSRFDADGDTVIDRKRIQYVPGTDGSDTVALDDGGWMTIWRNPGVADHKEALVLQRFNADGTQDGESRWFGMHAGYSPDITMFSDGGWLVTWTSSHSNWIGVYQQRFDANGEEISSHTAPFGAQRNIHVGEDKTHVFTRSDLPMRDFDGDEWNGVTIADIAGGGRLMLGNNRLEAGTYVSAADIDAGKMTFTPGREHFGQGYATFTYAVHDDGGTANGGQDTDTTPNNVTINVSPIRDEVLGTDRGERLTGTKFGDKIIGEGGNDVLRGRGGDDIFEFGPGHGRDIIMDFDVSGDDHDVLQFVHMHWSHHDLKHAITQNGDDTVIRDDRSKNYGDIIVLKGVRADDLDHTMFYY